MGTSIRGSVAPNLVQGEVWSLLRLPWGICHEEFSMRNIPGGAGDALVEQAGLDVKLGFVEITEKPEGGNLPTSSWVSASFLCV